MWRWLSRGRSQCRAPQLGGASWICSPPAAHPSSQLPVPSGPVIRTQPLCGLDVGEVRKMLLITASSCLAPLHHSQLIKHFLLLSTHPWPASLPPAHRAPAPSWLLSLGPFLPPLSFIRHFPTQFPGFPGKPNGDIHHFSYSEHLKTF